MLKKAFSTLACMDMNYKEVAEYCQKYGMEAIEVRLGNDGAVCGAVTIEEMARFADVETRTIERNIKKLKEKEIIDRVGADKNGHWIVKI